MKFLPALILSAVILGVAAPAFAHPHESDAVADLLEKSQALAEDAKVKAKAGGEAIIDSEMISRMADLLGDFAARVEVERGEGDGSAIWFDGDEVVRFKRDRNVDDRLSMTGLGKNLTVERETVIKDGKARTRIVIEMDGGEDMEIDLPGEVVDP